MKTLFVIGLVVLSIAGVGTYLNFPDLNTPVPVIYWVTDRNPARVLQVDTFHDWLRKHGHVTKDGHPVVELRLDMSNNDLSKKIIQGVSGVGSDIMDVQNGSNMRLFQQMGIIADVTDAAAKMGFGLDQTFPALEPEITVDGRQFMFPCNVNSSMFWVNPKVFAELGMDLPPMRWTFEEFERMGVEFNRRANPAGTPPNQRRFFADQVDVNVMRRSLGLSLFNETLTACDLDDPRYVRVLELRRKWIYEDNFLPTPDDMTAFATQQGYGGAKLALFGQGNFAMVHGGRYYLIKFRDFADLTDLQVVEPPHGGFPNVTIATRAAVLYAGSKHPELAKLFLSFLASDDYNNTIVEDGDSLPPNPRLTTTPAYLNPPAHRGEAQANQQFVRVAQELAIGGVYSPFILDTTAQREIKFQQDDFLIGNKTAQEAARLTAQNINARMADEVRRKPELQDEYERRCAIQKQVDEYLAAGKKLPRAWVVNPFYLRYYQEQGWLEGPAPEAEATPVSDL
jgi:multiple sugar transport system substrate-binding protein